MVQKEGPRLRDPASWRVLAAGTSSRNLGPTFFTIHVCTVENSVPKEILAYLVQISKWGNGDLCFCQYEIVHSHEMIYGDVVPSSDLVDSDNFTRFGFRQTGPAWNSYA